MSDVDKDKVYEIIAEELGVDKGSVGALEIGEDIGRAGTLDIHGAVEASVLARGLIVGEPNVDLRAAADDQTGPTQSKVATDLRPLEDDEAGLSIARLSAVELWPLESDGPIEVLA